MMANGWLQIIIYIALVAAFVVPFGGFMYRVFAGERTWLTPVLRPVETAFYRISGVDPAREQSWIRYSIGLLLFNLVGFLAVYALQRLQAVLPFNPAAMSAVSPDSSLNTAVSFATNTNWQ